jgi:hypothetical protein
MAPSRTTRVLRSQPQQHHARRRIAGTGSFMAGSELAGALLLVSFVLALDYFAVVETLAAKAGE